MKVLVSTTRQWNPGDEFILWGCKKIMKLNHFAIYDRNPDIWGQEEIEGNSWRGQGLSIFEYALIAGSPEWSGPGLKQLYKGILKHNKPVYMLGLGWWSNEANPIGKLEKAIIKKAKFVSTRDKITKKKIKQKVRKQVHCLPCPALFSTEAAKKRTEIKKIAVVVQLKGINEEIFDGTIELIKRLQKNYEVSLICHHFKEVYFAGRNGIDLPIYYSYRAEDYPGIYKKFDFIFSTRLHGCFLSASLEIPTVLLNNSLRCIGAVSLIPPVQYMPAEIADTALENWDMDQWYQGIKELKTKTWNRYEQLIWKS